MNEINYKATLKAYIKDVLDVSYVDSIVKDSMSGSHPRSAFTITHTGHIESVYIGIDNRCENSVIDLIDKMAKGEVAGCMLLVKGNFTYWELK